jgi:hypothetical protein
VVGLAALRQMDDRKGVPVLADVWQALTHRPQDRIEPYDCRWEIARWHGWKDNTFPM